MTERCGSARRNFAVSASPSSIQRRIMRQKVVEARSLRPVGQVYPTLPDPVRFRALAVVQEDPLVGRVVFSVLGLKRVRRLLTSLRILRKRVETSPAPWVQ